MRLSVIIPFHNEIELIQNALRSIYDNCKSISAYEVIIVNDGTLSDEEIAKRSATPENCNLIVLKNRYAKGPAGARNTALDAASGELIAFLDADDAWLPQKIDKQISAIDAGASFVATAYRLDQIGKNIIPPKSISKPIDIFLRRGIGTSSVLITSRLLGESRFRNFRFAQDIDFWFSLSKKKDFRYYRILTPLVVYSTSGSTRNKLTQLRFTAKVLKANNVGAWNMLRILLSYGLSGIYNHYIVTKIRRK